MSDIGRRSRMFSKSLGQGWLPLSLKGSITYESAKELERLIRGHWYRAIRLEIDSTGGNAPGSFACYAALKAHPHRVVANITGTADSGASVVAMGADIRRIHPDGSLVIHESRFGAIADDHAERMEQRAILTRDFERLADIYAAGTGQSRDQAKVWMWEETTFDAYDALAAGLVHTVVDMRGWH